MTPGTIVECIDDSTYAEQYLEIKKGEQYTVSWSGRCSSYLAGDYDGVRLVGINRGVCPQFGEEDPPFRATRFRVIVGPAVKGKTREVELT